MRLTSTLLLLFCLAACQHSGQKNSDAVRQGVLDHLAKAKFDVSAMDVKVDSVQFNGEQADANVAVTLKGRTDAQPMNFKYHLEHQGTLWVVVGRTTEAGHGGGVTGGGMTGGAVPNGANPHGGAMPPAASGGDNPHGGAMPGAVPGGGGAAGRMPSPDDLPPAKK